MSWNLFSPFSRGTMDESTSDPSKTTTKTYTGVLRGVGLRQQGLQRKRCRKNKKKKGVDILEIKERPFSLFMNLGTDNRDRTMNIVLLVEVGYSSNPNL